MATQDKATQIMDGLMLSYLSEKPNFREFMLAYISEMDFLFEQIEEVYYGRFLEVAIGAQLDVIGIILQQSRNVVLADYNNFGFLNAPGFVDGMADEATPADGGLFLDGESPSGDVEPLSDTKYRQLLLTKAACLNAKTNSIKDVYSYITITLGFAPSFIELEQVNTTGSVLGIRDVRVTLASSEVSILEAALCTYASRYYVPAGTFFTISLI
jgi:hypothetical protein